MKNILQLLLIIGMATLFCACPSSSITSTCGNGITQEVCDSLKGVPYLPKDMGGQIGVKYSLTSLISYREDINFKKANNLKVEFFLKEPYKRINFLGQGLRNGNFLPNKRVESNEEGWVDFPSWEKRDLNLENINNLGVLVMVGYKHIFPAIVYNDNNRPASINTYRFSFSSPTELSKLKLTIKDKNNILFSEKVDSPPRYSEILFLVPHQKFTSTNSGFKTMEVKAWNKDGEALATRKYKFYHESEYE